MSLILFSNFHLTLLVAQIGQRHSEPSVKSALWRCPLLDTIKEKWNFTFDAVKGFYKKLYKGGGYKSDLIINIVNM